MNKTTQNAAVGAPTYELRTIQDILDKIPTDRVDDCLKEMAVAIKFAQGMREVAKAVSEGMGDDEATAEVMADAIFGRLGFFTWTDDGLGQISLILPDYSEVQQ